jgi:hypothetical protein
VGLHYGRIMVSIILNREVAFTACGLWDGEQQAFTFVPSQGLACDDNLPSSFNALD